jgi:RsiW-degrading membrane proteinase PrsW (M82 family)
MPLFRGGKIALLLDLIWLIGQSYRMALGDHGFVLSFLGFTAGVGFCEEVCKAMPLILKGRSSGYASWRQAMLWGLISGVGFGVSEGITYCSDYYNGVSGPGIYAVRFISCVGLHAIWAGAVGITLYRRQGFLNDASNAFDWIFRLMAIVIVPMVLHGAYDTLLKQHYDVYALGVALVSFGWFAFQIELAKRQYDEPAGSPAMA